MERIHITLDPQTLERAMPSFTEFGLFIAAFIGAFAFGDDVLRCLGLARLTSDWRNRK